MPPAGNANFAWLQHILHHLAPAAPRASCWPMARCRSNQSGEGDIRKAMVEADVVDCMVALPGQLFYTTQIPACLWFLARDKSNGNAARSLRDRRGEILFIDARKLGTLVDRTRRELTDDDIAQIADTYHAWRGEKGAGEYDGLPGFCKSADAGRDRKHGHVLTPGAMSARRKPRTTASRSRKRCSGLAPSCASSRKRQRGWMRRSRPT